MNTATNTIAQCVRCGRLLHLKYAHDEESLTVAIRAHVLYGCSGP